MAIRKVKLLHVRGGNARPMWVYVMDNVDTVPSSGVTSSYATYSDANASMIQLTNGSFPDGVLTKTTIAYSTNKAVEYKAHCYGSDFSNVLNISELANGDKLVLENGSYILISGRREDEPSPMGTASVDLEYFTKDNERVYNGSYSFDCNYGLYYGTQGRYSFSSDVFPWKCKTITNYGWQLYRARISCTFQEHPGTQQYLPTYSNRWSGSVGAISVALSRKFFEGIPEYDPDDPYPDDDDSDDDYPDNPDGIPDDEPVPFPDDPDIDVLDSGFITLFAPTKAQVHNLASYMWAGGFDINTFRKIFADPMDCILGFNILPFQVTRGNLASVTVGNISTGVEMYKAGGQWQTIDCGSLNLGKIYDTYLDYAPYTKWSIYLPFIGLQQLSTDDVAHKTLHLKYKIDVLSCSCVAYLMCDDTILYQYSGSCGYAIPITSDNFASMISNIVSIASTGASIIASGGATAPMAVGAVASVANNVMGLKPDIKRGGSIGASAGLMGVQKPYVIIEIPNICKPAMQHKYLGYPSFITKTVRDVEGYSEWESIILDGIPCTDAERAEILEIMKGGLYV